MLLESPLQMQNWSEHYPVGTGFSLLMGQAQPLDVACYSLSFLTRVLHFTSSISTVSYLIPPDGVLFVMDFHTSCLLVFPCPWNALPSRPTYKFHLTVLRKLLVYSHSPCLPYIPTPLSWMPLFYTLSSPCLLYAKGLNHVESGAFLCLLSWNTQSPFGSFLYLLNTLGEFGRSLFKCTELKSR